MKTLFLIGLVVAGLVAAGAIHISMQGNDVEITVDKERLKAVTSEAVQEGKTVWRSASAAAPTTR
jgi:hypothetical protein